MKRVFFLAMVVMLTMIAQSFAEPTIDDYLVEVSLTEENFDQYFKLVQIENIQDYTPFDLNNDDYDYYIIASNVYDQGLMLYEGNVSAYQTRYNPDGSTHRTAWPENPVYEVIAKTKKGTVPKYEEYGDRRFGSATYLKQEFVKENAVSSDGGRMVTFLDGTEIGRNTYYLAYDDPETNSRINLNFGELYSLYPY